jgi:DNA/RNA endonuclease YhcR with UshA esterase domain
LKGSASRDSAPPLPADYTKNAKAVAEKQGALAGYRLASEIETCLKDAPVPLLPSNSVVTEAEAPKRISAFDASKYDDQEMIVTGKVVQVSVRPTITILDIDQPYPNSPFSAVVFEANAGKFTDLQKLKGQDVEISGTVTEYRNKPEIVLESPTQIKPTGAQ